MSINKENSRFEVTLVWTDSKGQITIDKAVGASLTEVLAHFLLVVNQVQERIITKKFEARIESTDDDDIPF